jgi:cold shock CspA family protein
MFGGFPSAGLASGPGVAPVGQEFDDFPRGILASGRRPAIDGRILGSIQEWKGRFGWIIPDEPIAHPEAHLKGGKVYLSQDDVMEVISGVGAHVSFYVYSDGNGLGALNCVPSDSETAKKKLIPKAKVVPKPKAKATPGRKRISETALSGKVKSWRGGFGFITPSDPVEHPLFTGSLFLHSNDIVEGIAEMGKNVTFYLYSDPQGLGAEECTFTDEGQQPSSSSAPAAGASASAPDTSGLLKAKPKASAGAAPVGGDGIMVATAKAAPKAGVMKATPKASAVVKSSGDPDLAKKMADNPDLAKQLSAWMFDPGG